MLSENRMIVLFWREGESKSSAMCMPHRGRPLPKETTTCELKGKGPASGAGPVYGTSVGRL